MLINYTTGYAGTGKSTELLKLSKTLNFDTSVVLCPTHKAVKRLMQGGIELELKTIHAILGWIPTINEEAEHINHIESTKKLGKPLEDYTDIVIDEGGMMSEEMLMEIIGKLEEQNNFETEHITIHVFLDPYQLLPVKGIQIQLDPETTTNLITQYRAESPDLVALFTKFVHYLEGKNKRDLRILESENVVYTNDLKLFDKSDKLLAYTNSCVGKYNDLISKQLNIKSYEGEYVQLGNLLELIKVDKIITPTIFELLRAYDNNTLFMQNNQINKKFLNESLHALLDCKDISFIKANGYIIPVLIGTNNAYLARQEAKKLALENKKNFKWVYALNRAFNMDFSFASTVHKAQGSEFDRVWIVKSDIQKSIMNNYYDTYARLMYVALSRAKKKVFIIEE